LESIHFGATGYNQIANFDFTEFENVKELRLKLPIDTMENFMDKFKSQIKNLNLENLYIRIMDSMD